MAVVSTLTTREDFTGEFKTTPQTGALWRFNEATPDGNTQLADSSDKGRPLRISGWSGTTASLIAGQQGRYFRFNTNNPATEKTYRIRTISDEKGADGSVITSVYAEAAFYDLAYSGEKAPVEFNAALPDEAMLYALEGTDWTLGLVDVSTLRTWECRETNALAILRMVQGLHGGDLIFDSREKKVHLLSFGGQDSGALFAYRKNLHSVKRVVDTRSLVTRLYAVGKDGLTFASINNGNPYVEDFTYSPEIRVSTLDLSGFSNPYQMLEFTRMRLAEYAKPRVSYVLSAMDLSVLTGYEHEQWTLGDIVTVDDRDLNLLIKTRIIRRQYNLQEPWNTVLELSTKLRELGDASNETLADTLDQPDSVQQEIKDMVPFNHLRNSRADDALAYWVNSGFEVDTENGVSGTASWATRTGFRFCTIRMWIVLCTGRMKPLTDGSCAALPSGRWGRRTCACGKLCQGKYRCPAVRLRRCRFDIMVV